MFSRYRSTIDAWRKKLQQVDPWHIAIATVVVLCFLPFTTSSMAGVLLSLPGCMLFMMAVGWLFGPLAFLLVTLACGVFLVTLFFKLLAF